MNKENKEMLEIAIAKRKNAYTPYSHFNVGACIKSKSTKKYYGGCNVENASFGATICAERGAVMTMVANEGKGEIEKVVVVTDDKNPAPPCALCLQVLAEFCNKNTPVLLYNLNNVVREYTFGELLPVSFTSFVAP